MSSSLHPDGKLASNQAVCTTCNESDNPCLHDLIEQRQMTRRGFLKTSLGATAGATALATLGSSVIDGLTT